MRKALEYLLELWSGLTVFLSNPWVPLDNNLVDLTDTLAAHRRSLRGPSLLPTAPVPQLALTA